VTSLAIWPTVREPSARSATRYSNSLICR
jgi:hypothetical protein